jgi:nicotinate-nucleotide adenylyltransferase
VVQVTLQRFDPSWVALIPAYQPPHKLHQPLTDAQHRLNMLELFIEGQTQLRIDSRELHRQGTSYTIDTVREIRRDVPQAGEILFLVGSDSLRELHTWRAAADLAREVTIVTVPRQGFDRGEEASLLSQHFNKDTVAKLLQSLLPVEPLPLSSTEIRDRVRRGESIVDATPAAVADYIREHNLYR